MTDNLPTVLKKAREDRGWTIRQAAGHMQVSYALLSLIESGKHLNPTRHFLQVAMKVYGLEAASLL